MEAVEKANLAFGKRWVALLIVILALLIGNAIGFVLVTATGSEGLDKPTWAGALSVAAQALIGAYLAFAGCRRFLKDHRYASAWLVVYVAAMGLAILFDFFSPGSDGRGSSAAESGQILYVVINAAVIEIARRTFLERGVG